METGKKIFYLSPDTGKESGNISTPEVGCQNTSQRNITFTTRLYGGTVF